MRIQVPPIVSLMIRWHASLALIGALKSRSIPMGRALSASKRRLLVDQSLTELSLLAKALCPEARVEVTTEHFEDEDGHIRIYPPAGMNEHESAALEERIAERCVDLLVAEGIFICTAVYN
jgi:hypothetical protein